MSIPGLLRMPVESSDPNEHVNFKSETFTVPGVLRCGNCLPLSDFEKLNNIGEGNYGIVYKVRHKKTNQIFALKKLKIQMESLIPQSSLCEITNLKLLKHENIIKLENVAVGEKLESTYLILEFCKYSLDKVIDDDPSYLQRPQIKNIMHQLFSGLDYIHKENIFHRDINPANILFNEEGMLKIADFGSSRKIAEGSITPNVGTQWYRAPEILFGSVNYSSSVDIWSAGCVFSELLLQKILFRGNSDFAIIDLIINLLGSPTESEWPEHLKLPLFQDYNLRVQRFNNFRYMFSSESDATNSLIHKMLVYNPSVRISAEKCLKHPYFLELPEACSSQALLNALEASETI